VLEFEAPSGNIYAWDNEVGIFIPFSPAMKEIICRKSLSKTEVIEELREDFGEEEATYFYDWMEKWEKIKPNKCDFSPRLEITASDIKSSVLRYGLMHLTLCVTEDCNFRCKYCVYSEHYKYDRNHSNRYMDFTTATKALDYYFSLLEEGKRHNPLRKPSIGFYGGEPLLNFKLIKRCVEFVQEKYGDQGTVYNITTNGSLLQKERASWLMDNRFIISVSLDGPEEEHNRLRVYRNGKGTFRDIMDNLSFIMQSDYKDIFCLPVFDWNSDLFKKEEFFNKDDIPSVQRIFPVEDGEGCSYYQQFQEEDRISFLEQLKRAWKCYFENLDHQAVRKKSSIFDDLIGQSIMRDLLMSNSIYIQNPIMPVSAACVPGRKIFVDVTGNYHICERINNGFPIGTVDTGLNFERILGLMCEYKASLDKCYTCNVTRRCLCCYKSLATDNGFSCASKICSETESNMKKSFIETFTVAEKYPSFIDGSDFKYKNVRKHFGDH
jgi:uncharacterized protein